ncbi:transketolase [bacterium I07]|nr:transketolase [bacterium I07]
MNTQTNESKLDQLAANTIRFLSADGVQKANSGHPGMPMGMADCAYILWHRFLQYQPKDPKWPNRDRFILSAGHGSMLLYSLLYLAGYDVDLSDLKSFRQWGSKTPGHPEYGCLPGIETTTGPLGQGFATGVGMSLASKIMANRFNRPDFSPVDHYIYGIVSDGDLMEGVASEAASLAGHLKLGNIVYLYDDNQITIEGNTSLAFSEDVEKRFLSYGWHTIAIDGHDHGQIESAIREGMAENGKPTLILAKTHIAYGSPNKQDTAGAHGSPLGEAEILETKQKMDWPSEEPFFVPEEVKALFNDKKEKMIQIHLKWHEQYESWAKAHPDLASLWTQMADISVPDDIDQILVQVLPDSDAATRATGGKVLQTAAELVPSLIGGSADLAPSTKTMIEGVASITADEFAGRNLHFGIREHGMGAMLNGMALYGGFIPYGSTFLVFSDYVRPAIRLSALMEQKVLYIFTHDSIFVGEDGPTHQPVEHVASLRAIPNLYVFRPADAVETAMSWAFALQNPCGPSALCLTRQKVPNFLDRNSFKYDMFAKGGYEIGKQVHDPNLVLVASGSEVSVIRDARQILEADGLKVRTVSMPCLDLFDEQTMEYKEGVIPQDLPVVVVEAGIEQGWRGVAGSKYLFIGMNRFGASAPANVLAEKFGFTGAQVADKAQGLMS